MQHQKRLPLSDAASNLTLADLVAGFDHLLADHAERLYADRHMLRAVHEKLVASKAKRYTAAQVSKYFAPGVNRAPDPEAEFQRQLMMEADLYRITGHYCIHPITGEVMRVVDARYLEQEALP